MREGKLGRYLRYASLAGFLGFMTYVAYRHQVVGGGPSGVPPVDTLCPFGGLESLYSYLKHGTFLRRVAMSSLLLFGTVAASTLLLGRTFCGWICPLGALGEAAGALGRRLGFKVDQRRIPHTARHVKLLILGVVLAGSWATGTLVFRPYDPWVAWAHLGGGLDEIAANPWGFAVLALLVILAGMGISRFFCRYLCPLGGGLWILQKLSLTRVERHPDRCVNCGACDRACPMGITVSTAGRLSNGDCISCGECVESCPAKGALDFRALGRKLSPLAVGIIGLGLFLGAYGVAKVSGGWRTFSPTSLEAKADPAEGIFGWMTVEEAASKVALPVEEFMNAAGISPDSPRDVPLKRMEGVDDEAVKAKVGAYLKARETSRDAKAPNPEEIKGSQTLAEVAEIYRLKPEEILETAGWPVEMAKEAENPLKEMAARVGSEVSAIRAAVRKLKSR